MERATAQYSRVRSAVLLDRHNTGENTALGKEEGVRNGLNERRSGQDFVDTLTLSFILENQ